MKRKHIIYTISTIFWMLVIFYFSAQPAEQSGSLSGYVWQRLFAFITLLFGKDTADLIVSIVFNEHFIRKCGHFFEYLILGVLCTLTLRSYEIKRTWLVSGLICVLYAASDEFHQVFVPGRGPAVADVLLDSIAAVTGIVITIILRNKRRK